MARPDPVTASVARAHGDYHAETSTHRGPDELVDDVVTHRTLAPHLLRALLFLVAPTVLLFLWLVLGYLASMSSPSATADLVETLLGVAVVVLYLTGVAAFLAPAKEPIAEWSRLVEGQGAAAGAVTSAARAAAAARRTPAQVRPATVTGVDVLLFRQHAERAMLLVQPYGEDLYVGWTLWRSRSTATLLGHFLRDTFARALPAPRALSPRVSAELRAAATRALRESVHSLTREAVAVGTQAEPDAEPGRGAPAPARGTGHGVEREATHAERPVEAPSPGALPSGSIWRPERRERPSERVRADQDWGPPPREEHPAR